MNFLIACVWNKRSVIQPAALATSKGHEAEELAALDQSEL